MLLGARLWRSWLVWVLYRRHPKKGCSGQLCKSACLAWVPPRLSWKKKLSRCRLFATCCRQRGRMVRPSRRLSAWNKVWLRPPSTTIHHPPPSTIHHHPPSTKGAVPRNCDNPVFLCCSSTFPKFGHWWQVWAVQESGHWLEFFAADFADRDGRDPPLHVVGWGNYGRSSSADGRNSALLGICIFIA